MSDQLKIYCKNISRYENITAGETLAQIYTRLKDQVGIVPICAMVNNKTESMNYAVFSPKQVEFHDATSPAGKGVYSRSLCMLLYKSVRDNIPGAKLRIEHSIAGGYYCQVYVDGNVNVPSVSELRAIEETMRHDVEADIPFISKERLTADVKGIFEREGLNDKVLLLDTIHEIYSVYTGLGDTYDSYYGKLAPSTGLINVFALSPYKEGFLLLGPDKENPDIASQPVRQEKMYQAFKEYIAFNNVIGVRNVGELNRAVTDGRSSDLINVAEALHDKKISSIADDIARRYHDGGARVVLVAGPSSSGKTTTTKRLSTYLMTNLLRPVMISLDNYFVDRDATPLDENGERDYEHLHALDLDLFNSHLTALLRGEEVELPYYSFELGKRIFKGDRVKLHDGDVLLMEGIHGLNPELTPSIPDEQKYRVYVSALTTLSIDDHSWISTSDNRLLRRIIRDYKYRGTSPVETLSRWASVRRGEERWIFPFQENADSTFNSSLIFELGVMREYGLEILRRVPNDCIEYGEAYRLRKILELFQPIGDRHIPPTSLLREFLGGSSFHY